jgi:DNA-binding NarL/FixJ family response regulator
MKAPEVYRIAVVDDHPVIWDGLTLMLEAERNMRLHLKVKDGADLFFDPRLKECDIVILDITMPRMNGIDAAKRLRQEFPRIKVLIYTMHDSKNFFQQCIGLGVRGYILKRDPPETMVNALRNIAAGKLGISPSISPMLVNPESPDSKNRELFKKMQLVFNRLTDRERDVLGMLASGMTSKQIAEFLAVKVNTVNKHRENIRHKLGGYNINELIFFVKSNNLL